VSRQAWVELLRSRPDWGYRYAGHDVTPVDGDWIPEMSEAQQTGQAVLRNDARGTQEATLAIPLKVRDETVGVLGFRKGTPDETWTAEETEILQSFAAQVELALDSARLYQDAQRAAVEERLTSQITGRMRETLDVDMVLQTAIREMGTVLGIPKVEVRMGKGAPLQGISETSTAGNERAPRWGAEKGKEYGSLD
jgi:GAF domain-containing protein